MQSLDESREHVLPIDRYFALTAGIERLADKARTMEMRDHEIPTVRFVGSAAAIAWKYSVLLKSGKGVDPDRRIIVLPATEPRPALLCPTLHHVTELVTVRLRGVAPRISGWAFAAVLEQVTVLTAKRGRTVTETQIRRFADAPELPHGWHTGDGQTCDHCGMRRARRIMIVLHHVDGRVTRVLKTCLRDFLGHPSPEKVLNLVTAVRNLLETVSDDVVRLTGFQYTFDPTTFVTVACVVARIDGFVSKQAAYDSDGEIASTAAITSRVLIQMANGWPEPDSDARERYRITAEDAAVAEEVMRWARTLPPTSEFDSNISIAAHMTRAIRPNHGILAWLPWAYKTYKRQQAEVATHAPSLFQGEIGARITRAVTVYFVQEYETDYDVLFLVLMIDAEGNRYKWWTTTAARAVGEHASVRMTVKAHISARNDARDDVTGVNRVRPVPGTWWVAAEAAD